MTRWLARRLDWLAIRLASAAMTKPSKLRVEQRKRIQIPDPLLAAERPLLPSLQFYSESGFTFTSSLTTPYAVNNQVHGKLFSGVKASGGKPTLLLLHGWNAEYSYHYQFPWMARHLTRRGFNTMAMELPYHCHRRPRGPGVIHDFISTDLECMIQAVRQSVADARALIGWLEASGRGPVMVWGFSLGAWLAGLMASVEPDLQGVVLTTPIVEMDRAIQELAFCAPVRAGLEGASVSLGTLSLMHYRPLIEPSRILIMASRYDEFVPLDSLESLRETWDKPHFWSLPHGHISILMAFPTLIKTMDWIKSTGNIDSRRPVA